MSRAKELMKNTGILLVAKISTQAINFLLIPLFTSLLTTKEYGEIDIYSSVVMILVPFLTLQIEMGLFRYFIEENNIDDKKRIVTTSLIIIFKMIVLFTIGYSILVFWLNLRYKLLLYLYYLCISISTVLQQICRAYGKNFTYGMATFIISVFAVILNIALIYILGFKVEGFLVATIVSNLSGSLYMIQSTKIYHYFDRSYYSEIYKKRLLNYSLPLVLNQISSWAINYSDRMIILFLWGASANGIYSLANKFSSIVNTFFGVYNLAWTENVIRSMKDDKSVQYINKIFFITYNMYMFCVTSVINILPLIYFHFISGQYLKAYYHIPFLLLGMFFSGMSATIGSIYIAYGKTKDVSFTTILSGISNILVHLLLASNFKLFAASISTVASFFLLFIYRYIFVKKFFPLSFSFLKVVVPSVIYLYVWYAYYSTNTYLIVLGIFFNVFYFFYFIDSYKSSFKNLVKKT